MVVPFGVSVGDFIAGINLINNVIDALNDRTGSGTEYRKLVQELRLLRSAIETLRDIEIDVSSEIAAQLAETISQCGDTIQEFLVKHQKYDKALGVKSTPKQLFERLSLHAREIQWNKYTKDDLRKFHAHIQVHTASINFLLTKAHM